MSLLEITSRLNYVWRIFATNWPVRSPTTHGMSDSAELR